MKKFHSQVRAVDGEANCVRNHLLSILEDNEVVDSVHSYFHFLPLIANLRNGAWYHPSFVSSCYFKSTDGHDNQWTFSLLRLNLGTAMLLAKRDGGIIVDSTRRGKSFPDSIRATVMSFFPCIF